MSDIRSRSRNAGRSVRSAFFGELPEYEAVQTTFFITIVYEIVPGWGCIPFLLLLCGNLLPNLSLLKVFTGQKDGEQCGLSILGHPNSTLCFCFRMPKKEGKRQSRTENYGANSPVSRTSGCTSQQSRFLPSSMCDERNGLPHPIAFCQFQPKFKTHFPKLNECSCRKEGKLRFKQGDKYNSNAAEKRHRGLLC